MQWQVRVGAGLIDVFLRDLFKSGFELDLRDVGHPHVKDTQHLRVAFKGVGKVFLAHALHHFHDGATVDPGKVVRDQQFVLAGALQVQEADFIQPLHQALDLPTREVQVGPHVLHAPEVERTHSHHEQFFVVRELGFLRLRQP